MGNLPLCSHGINIGSINPCVECAKNKMWYIRNIQNNSAWNNQWGWVDLEKDMFTLFTEFEKEVFSLPIEGQWCLLK